MSETSLTERRPQLNVELNAANMLGAHVQLGDQVLSGEVLRAAVNRYNRILTLINVLGEADPSELLTHLTREHFEAEKILPGFLAPGARIIPDLNIQFTDGRHPRAGDEPLISPKLISAWLLDGPNVRLRPSPGVDLADFAPWLVTGVDLILPRTSTAWKIDMNFVGARRTRVKKFNSLAGNLTQKLKGRYPFKSAAHILGMDEAIQRAADLHGKNESIMNIHAHDFENLKKHGVRVHRQF